MCLPVRGQPVPGRRQQDESVVARRNELADRARQAAGLQRDGQVGRERVGRRRPVVADQACQRRQLVRVGRPALEAQCGRDVGQEQRPVQLVDNQVVAGEHDPVFRLGADANEIVRPVLDDLIRIRWLTADNPWIGGPKPLPRLEVGREEVQLGTRKPALLGQHRRRARHCLKR